MIMTLVKKEILESIKEPRFILGWLLVLILSISSVIMLSEDVRQRAEQRDLAQKSREEMVSQYAHTNRIAYFMLPVRPIERSEAFVRGINNVAEEQSFFTRPLSYLFANLDLVYIFSILLSLLAIIFTYDSVCGEREQGTLKIIHTTAVSRTSLVLAKWLGMMAIIAIPLVASVILMMLIGSLYGGVSLSTGVLVEILLVLFAGIVYIGFFTALGVMISATVKSSGASILVLLFLWVMFVLAIPNASPILASQISPIPSVNAVERETRALTDVIRDNRITEEENIIKADMRRTENIPASVTSFGNPQQYMDAGWPEDRAKEVAAAYVDAWREMVDRVNREQQEKANAILRELELKIEEQQFVAKAIALSSPTSAFTFFATDIASVGLDAEKYYFEERGKYMGELNRFVDQRLKDEEARLGQTIGSNDFIDLTGKPVYQHHPAPLDERLSGVIVPAGLLVLFTIVALALAAVMYLRYDIR